MGKEKVRIVCLDIDQRGYPTIVKAQGGYLPQGHPLYGGFRAGIYTAELDPYWDGKGATIYLSLSNAKKLLKELKEAIEFIEQGGKGCSQESLERSQL